jgi:hypothetical protein
VCEGGWGYPPHTHVPNALRQRACDVTSTRRSNAPELGLGYEAMKKSHPNIDYLGTCKLVYKVTTPFAHNHNDFTHTTSLSPDQIALANSWWPAPSTAVMVLLVLVVVMRKAFGRKFTRVLGM